MCVSDVGTYSRPLYSAIPRFTEGLRPRGSRREYCHSRSPVAASSACTLSPYAWTNITPSCTSGVTSFAPLGSAQLHARRRLPTLARVICASGLKPWASNARRHVSHSPSGGLLSIASVTGVNRSSGFGVFGGGGIDTPSVSPPPGPPAADGSIAVRRRVGSAGS